MRHVTTSRSTGLMHVDDGLAIVEPVAMASARRTREQRADETAERCHHQHRPSHDLPPHSLPGMQLIWTLSQEVSHFPAVAAVLGRVSPPLHLVQEILDAVVCSDSISFSAAQVTQTEERLPCGSNEPQESSQQTGGLCQCGPVVMGVRTCELSTTHRSLSQGGPGECVASDGTGAACRHPVHRAARNDETPHAGGVCVSWTGSALCPRRR